MTKQTLSPTATHSERIAFLNAHVRRDWGFPSDGQMNADGGDGGDSGNGSQEGGNGGTGAGNPDGGTSGAPAEVKPWGDDKDFNPEKAWNLIQNLRNDKSKTETKVADAAKQAQEELTTKLGKALGLIKEDAAPTVESLTDLISKKDTTVQELQNKNRDLQIKAGLAESITEAKANPKLMRIHLDGTDALKDLDPEASDFQEKLTALVKEQTEKFPHLAQVAGGKGTRDYSGQSGQSQVTKAQFDAMSLSEKNALYHSNEALFNKLSGN